MDEDGWSRARARERWFAVHSQPKREWRAEAQLVNQGLRVFLPKQLKTVRHARKFRTVLAPFFPRYLFVALDAGSGSLAQHQQHHRSFLPGDGGRESTASSDRRCRSHDRGDRPQGDTHLEIGSSVRLLAGPFADQLGRLSRLDDAGRVHVLLEIMGASIPVQMPREFVAAA